MGAAEIVVTVVTAVACLGMGVFLGSLPFKRDELTEWHMKYQQLGGVLACGIVIVLMLLGYDLASWLAIAALAVGVAVSRIPVVRRGLLARFPELHPAERQSPLRKARQRSAGHRLVDERSTKVKSDVYTRFAPSYP